MLAELAGAVRKGRVSAKELVGLAYERIARLNGDLNAAIALRPEEEAVTEAEKRQASASESVPLPLLGLPLLVKDNTDVAGMRTEIGDRASARGGGRHRGGEAAGIGVGVSTAPASRTSPAGEGQHRRGRDANREWLAPAPGRRAGGAGRPGGRVPPRRGRDRRGKDERPRVLVRRLHR